MRNGVDVIVPLISPYRESREHARQELPRFLEVYVDCPLKECVRRDVKGLYARAISGEIDHFTAQKRFVRRDGQWIWTNRTVTLARDAANDAPYLIQVIEDITERKRTQDQLERLRRTREVLANCNRALVHAVDEAAMLAEVCRIAVA